MTSLATACFLLLILNLISAHDQRKMRSNRVGILSSTWSRIILNWTLAGLAIILLSLAWGPERAIAFSLMLLTLAGAAGLVIRRVFDHHQRIISGVLLSLLLVLGSLQLVSAGI